MTGLRLVAILLMIGGAQQALAQGNDSPSTAARSDDGGGAVQIGAGSTDAVTTGSSGPQQKSSEGERGEPAPFEITPAERAFLGPAPLPISPPRALLCMRIADPAARRTCESRAAAHDKGGKRG